jgi:AcrR family transcriptional regulator
MAETAPEAHPRPKAAENARRRRERVLHAATRHFSEQSYDDVSMSAIAKEAQVSHGLAFHVFGSKQALFEAVLAQAVSSINDMIELVAAGPAEGRAARVIDGFFRHVEREQGTFRLALRAGLGPEESLRRIVAEGRDEAARRILRTLGVTRPSRLALIGVRGWMGGLDSTILAWLEGRRVRRADLVALLERTLEETVCQCGYAGRIS